MDPLSIASGCAGLITAIGQLSFSIQGFVRTCREARGDLDRVSRELHSLQTVLELIQEDATDEERPFPSTIQHHVSGIVSNCNSVVVEVQSCITRYGDGKLKSRAAWAINGQGDMEKLRSSLEAHKSALELALDMLALTLTRDIKIDTTEILDDTAAIKDDTAQILHEIAQLQARLPETATTPNDYILQRFLEDMTTYTETTLDTTLVEIGDDDRRSSRSLSRIEEHDESSDSSNSKDYPVLQWPGDSPVVQRPGGETPDKLSFRLAMESYKAERIAAAGEYKRASPPKPLPVGPSTSESKDSSAATSGPPINAPIIPHIGQPQPEAGVIGRSFSDLYQPPLLPSAWETDYGRKVPELPNDSGSRSQDVAYNHILPERPKGPGPMMLRETTRSRPAQLSISEQAAIKEAERQIEELEALVKTPRALDCVLESFKHSPAQSSLPADGPSIELHNAQPQVKTESTPSFSYDSEWVLRHPLQGNTKQSSPDVPPVRPRSRRLMMPRERHSASRISQDGEISQHDRSPSPGQLLGPTPNNFRLFPDDPRQPPTTTSIAPYFARESHDGQRYSPMTSNGEQRLLGVSLSSYRGNVVIDIPMRDDVLKHVLHAEAPNRDEFTHSRLSFITCPAAHYPMEVHAVRANLFARPRQTKFFLSFRLSHPETVASFADRWNVIHDSMLYAQHKLPYLEFALWKQIVVHIHCPMDFIGLNPSVIKILEAIGIKNDFNTFIANLDGVPLDEPIYEYSTKIKGRPVELTIREYTVQLRPFFNPDNPDKATISLTNIPIQVVLTSPRTSVQSEVPQTRTLLVYHDWMKAIAKIYKPEYIVEMSTINVFTLPENKFLYEAWTTKRSLVKVSSPGPSVPPRMQYFVLDDLITQLRQKSRRESALSFAKKFL